VTAIAQKKTGADWAAEPAAAGGWGADATTGTSGWD